ncbi:MAG: ABC transporter permease [Armatimonadota bacterium]|nr:ABC transporter permease [Armatimonadota bacterium]
MSETMTIDRSGRPGGLRQLPELLGILTVAQLKARYRRSFLGFLWSLIMPLFQIVVIGFVFQGLLQHRIPNYTLVFLTALLPWIFFSDAVLTSCPVYLKFRDVVKKIYFPRWALPLSVVFAAAVHFGLSMVILFAIFVVVPVRFTAAFWPLIPLTLMLTTMLAGLSLLFSVLHTYYQDVEYALTAIVRMLLFVTPVMYPTDQIPEAYQYWFLFNPLAAICEGFRSILPGYELPRPEHLVCAAVISVLCLGVGMVVFRRMSPQLPEVL